MASQKVENLLNLALDATEEEREKSLELDVGYNPIDREWDLIIKYSKSLERVRLLATETTDLLNEYAIITVPESRIEAVSNLPEVEYIEKPKRLFFQVENGKRVSCINEVQSASPSLYGRGTLIAVVDSGIDYANADFRNADGSTRILELWDQSTGDIYDRAQIDEALQAETRAGQLEIVPSVDTSGHGTAVAGIAAGNGRGARGRYAGVAPESELLIVKLASPRQDGFPRTTELMRGLDYVIRRGIDDGRPLSVNISFGNTYGAHNGSSLLERYIDSVSNIGRTCISVGTGNEAGSGGHTSGILVSGEEIQIPFAVQDRQPTLNLQIWKAYTDEVEIALLTPSGVMAGPFEERLGPQRFTVGGTEILLYYGEPSPYSTDQEIFIDFLPRESYITGGVWQVLLRAGRVVDGRYDMWFPSTGILNPGTGFRYPTENITLTIPSSASRVITVAAYNALTFSYAPFSGRGYAGESRWVKPDIAAPGVNVMTVAAGGGYAMVTGTSFATPFVTGSAALLMEWGIVQGNDPYLYGEKVKAYLRRGARQLPGFDVYPNPYVGWGALCVRDSLPI